MLGSVMLTCPIKLEELWVYNGVKPQAEIENNNAQIILLNDNINYSTRHDYNFLRLITI